MNTLQQSSMFSRRNGSGIRIIFFVAVGALFLYGIYMYHDLHTRLKRTEDRADKFRQQHDSISAQLQVVYEHKSRLEKSLQHERSEHRKTREDLLAKKAEAESKHTNEKTELLNRIESINQQHKMLKSQHEDLQSEFSKVRNQMSKQGEDHKRVINQHNVEYMQLKQEKENEIASLKDQIANLQRKKLDLQSQVEKSRQMDQLNQAQLRQQNQQLQQSLQQQQGGLQQAGNHHQQLQEFIPQHQVVPQGGQPAGVGNYPQGAAYQNQQPIGAQQNLKQQQQGAVGQSQLRGGLQQGVQQGGRQYNLQGGGLHGEPAGPVGLAGHPGQAQQQLHNINMQMAKPGKHLLPKQGHSPEHSPGQGNGEEQPLRKQVLPPRLAPEHKDSDVDNVNKDGDTIQRGEESERGERDKRSLGDAGNGQQEVDEDKMQMERPVAADLPRVSQVNAQDSKDTLQIHGSKDETVQEGHHSPKTTKPKLDADNLNPESQDAVAGESINQHQDKEKKGKEEGAGWEQQGQLQGPDVNDRKKHGGMGDEQQVQQRAPEGQGQVDEAQDNNQDNNINQENQVPGPNAQPDRIQREVDAQYVKDGENEEVKNGDQNSRYQEDEEDDNGDQDNDVA